MLGFIMICCAIIVLIRVCKSLSTIRYDACFAEMKGRGVAMFGKCYGLSGGDKNTNYIQHECIDCPYFVAYVDKLK